MYDNIANSILSIAAYSSFSRDFPTNPLIDVIKVCYFVYVPFNIFFHIYQSSALLYHKQKKRSPPLWQ